MIKVHMLNQFQKGSTLLEILVSVFILGFGLLALVSMQLKTVMTAREAESQTIVAQATDSLIEGMTMNPILSASSPQGDAQIILRSFKDYSDALNDIQAAGSCNANAGAASAASSAIGISKKDMAAQQVCTFFNRLQAIPNVTNIKMQICDAETAANSVNTPQLNAAGNNIACGNGGTVTVLKVVWQQELEDGVKYASSSLKMNAAKDAIVYGYQAVISQ